MSNPVKIDRSVKHGRHSGGLGIEILFPGLILENGDSGVGAIGRIDHAHFRPGSRVPMHPHKNDEILTYLAAEAGMSRSAFFARFTRVVGHPPMEYLLAWRMALAKRLLRTRKLAIEHIAAQVGYGSASTFSTAFARHVGMSPTQYIRAVKGI